MTNNNIEQNQRKVEENLEDYPVADAGAAYSNSSSKGKSVLVANKKIVRILGVAAVALFVIGSLSVLVYRNISSLVVARVNGSFITRSELNKELVNLYGPSVLEELINKRVMDAAIAAADVEVTDEEMAQEIAEIESQILAGAGMSLEEYLASQGIPREDFEDQVRLQVTLEKLLVSEVEVSEEAVDAFMEENGEFLSGETEEEKRAEAVEILVDRALGLAFQDWLAEQRAEASVTTYLE